MRVLHMNTHGHKLDARVSECCCGEWWEMRSEVSRTYGELCAWLGLDNRCKHLQLQHTHLCQADVGTTTHWSDDHVWGREKNRWCCIPVSWNLILDGGCWHWQQHQSKLWREIKHFMEGVLQNYMGSHLVLRLRVLPFQENSCPLYHSRVVRKKYILLWLLLLFLSHVVFSFQVWA